MFPIIEHRTGWDKRRDELVEWFGREVVEVIETFQPFGGAASPGANPLLILQKINNTDKHRVRPAWLTALPIDKIEVAVKPRISAELRSLVEGDTLVSEDTELFEVVLSEAPEEVRARVNESPSLTFDIEDHGWLPAPQSERLLLEVSGVVRRLAEFFPAVNDLEARMRSFRVRDPAHSDEVDAS